MSTTRKSKKTPKPPQGRPVSTAFISQPAVEDTSSLFSLSSFSPGSDFFAYVSLAVDKHRLRVYNTTTGQAVADHTVEAARVSCVIWSTLDLGEDNNDSSQPSRKKRKKQESVVGLEAKGKATDIVVLGLSDGRILCFSHMHDRVLRTLSHASSTSAILALATEERRGRWLIWTSGADGTLRLWDANKNEIVGSWKNDDRIPYTSLTIRPADDENQTNILAASHNIRLLSKSEAVEGVVPKKLQQLATFTGHASSVRSTSWDHSKLVATRFISQAESDRFLYVWDIPDSSDADGRAVASIPLDSHARSSSLSASVEDSSYSVLLTLSTSDKIALYPIPHQISSPTSSNRSPAKLPTLHSRCNIIPASTKPPNSDHVINVSFVNGEAGNVRVARLVHGVRPVFTIVRYLDETGQFIENLQLEDVPETPLEDTHPLIPTKRYNESSIAVGSGIELGHDEDMEETTVRDIDGDLEVDLAELSLGQRLAAVTDADAHRSSDTEDENATGPTKSKASNKKKKSGLDIVPANSLTRTLIQALHSSDTRLIETCLAHSNPDLIRNTVRRLPSELAIPLLSACVERLGRGARAAGMKGGGAGASAQRGMTLVIWIRTVLAMHTGHLMTVPNLVARLSGLHATLTARLALQDSLLSLGGRLDMVLSQIEMRSSLAPTPLPKNGRVLSHTKEIPVKRYVEGESDSSDDENAQMDVEIEVGEDDGSVEDVELGGDSEEDGGVEDEEGSEEERDEDEEDEDEDEDEDESRLNEFIDNEAEYSEDENEDESDHTE